MPSRIINKPLNSFETKMADDWFNHRVSHAVREQDAALEDMAVIKIVISAALTRVVHRQDEELRDLWTGWRRLLHVTGHTNFPHLMDAIQRRMHDLSEEVDLAIGEENGEWIFVFAFDYYWKLDSRF